MVRFGFDDFYRGSAPPTAGRFAKRVAAGILPHEPLHQSSAASVSPSGPAQGIRLSTTVETCRARHAPGGKTRAGPARNTHEPWGLSAMLYLQKSEETPSPEVQRGLRAADGYLTLGLPDEALRELHELPTADRDASAVRLAHIRILLHQQDWRAAERLSREGAALFPHEGEFTVQRAFSLQRLEHGREAAAVLRAAPDWIRRTGILHYNLACYEARLGDLAAARQCIDAAIQLNGEMKKRAKIDPDLAALWN
jgi:Flp pilus assembly protein TadD